MQEDGSIWPIPPQNGSLVRLPYSKSVFTDPPKPINEWLMFKAGERYNSPSGQVGTLNPDMIEMLPN